MKNSQTSNAIEEGFICILIVSMTVLVFAEVISRFIFNIGFMWIEETTLTFGACLVLFGMSYGVKVGAHIGVDAFVNSLPAPARKVTAIAAVLICIAYSSMFFYGSVVYINKMYTIGLPMEDIHLPASFVNLFDPDSAWDIFRVDAEEPLMPIWIAHSSLLIGFALLFVRFAQLLLQIIQGKHTGFTFADEAKESMHLIQEEEQNPAENTAAEKSSPKTATSADDIVITASEQPNKNDSQEQK